MNPLQLCVFVPAEQVCPSGSKLLDSIKLPQVEVALCVPDHTSEGHKAWQSLCKKEKGKYNVNSSLQRLDEDGLIKQLEKDQRELEEETKQPESSELWDLFLQVSCVSKVQPYGFYESHEDEDGDEDELVVVWQSRILEVEHQDLADPPQREKPHVEEQWHLERQAWDHLSVVSQERDMIFESWLSKSLINENRTG